ncbi:putative synaptotagmin-like mitochondrial-lipid-binding domain-containing protein [Helianthus annuus]|nr:putative synaptotagmin-like mitochondrial-lipid-binding domain-containing protein [Helianthus annuus]
MVAVALFVGFVVGALVVIGVEVVGVLFLLRKLGKKTVKQDIKVTKSEGEELQFQFPNKQGSVWILEKEKVPKASQCTDKISRQEKRKIEIIEVTPIRKHASIKDKSLIVTEPDRTLTKIDLLGCVVEAVSATNLPSRKWAKKYPIKVENKSSAIYHGSKLFYMYFETSSEKESWCQALRLASCDDKEKLTWFYKARAEFHSYLASLNVEYPSFLKPSIGFNPEIGDRSIKVDGSSSKKVRDFLKKFGKKTSKIGRDDKKFSENSVGGSSRLSQTEKKPNYGAEEKVGSRNGVGSQSSDNDKISSDEGTLCCNLLISRLFFDAKSNVNLRNSIQARIQRTLSTIRTPSYIGEIICTGVNPGNVPPYIHGMRVLPTDLKEVVAMEIDIEYHGGVVLDIETRLEVQELENSDSKPVDDVATDLLEGFGEQLKLNQPMDQKGDENLKLEDTKSLKGNEQASSTVPKWKSVINSVAKQVSQVPLSLAIRVTTLRGTLRVHIKPPPSDQIWFGFTSMPDIDFSLESAVGDHKITSGHIALFIINKFKAAIRETTVLPNSESVTIPFMIAEKNDWIPQKAAPFIWTNPELTTEPATERTVIQEVHRSQSSIETHPQEAQDVHTSNRSSTETTHDKTTSSQSDDEKSPAYDDEKSAATDEKTPLLESDKQPPPQDVAVEENQLVALPDWRPSPSAPQVVVVEENNEAAEGELRRMGTRAKMLGLRKKMGEKLDEKRRNLEEKGRHIVEKMRGPGGI